MPMAAKNPVSMLSEHIESYILPPKRVLLPNVDDVYELKLAFYENLILSDSELLRNGAYFAQIGDSPTRHFLMCTGEPLRLPEHSSARLKSFFEKNIFRTGYATHGLFPYRGKFHPQMIKGLINVMGINPGETVLDPMMGSGTVPVEAMLMGINAVGVDVSPFCRFMAQTKIDALTMSLEGTKAALDKCIEVYDYFLQKVGKHVCNSKTKKETPSSDFAVVFDSAAEYITNANRNGLSRKQRDNLDTYTFLLLAFLDCAGYMERSKCKSPYTKYRAILDRYVFVVEKIQAVLHGVENELANATLLEGDARNLPLEDASIDGIIFSPPYSFAIDYLQNDLFHLNFLGVDANVLRSSMIGLRGRSLADRFRLFQQDMCKVLSECARVLRKGRICTIIVGTNSNQLSKVLGVPPDEVPGLHQLLVDSARVFGLRQIKMISRPIIGISNTMRREYILLMVRE